MKKLLKILATIFFSFFVIAGLIGFMDTADPNQKAQKVTDDVSTNPSSDNITVKLEETDGKNSFFDNFLVLVFGAVPIYFMWFRKKKNNSHNSSVSSNIANISSNEYAVINNQRVPNDIIDILWFINGKYKNYSPNLKKFTAHGYTFTIEMSGDIEPSVIDVTLPVHKPKNLMFVEALTYFPTYNNLNPEQRWVYLNWLKNIDNSVDIGYVFLFYYGLERYLFTDNYEIAFVTIIKLREHHKNNSFLSYSFNALLAALLFHKRVDLFQKLIDISEDIEVSILYLYIKYMLNINIEANEIIEISSDIGFTNKRYIKSNYDLFIETLKNLLEQKYNINAYPVNTIDINKCNRDRQIIVANISLSPREISIPNILTNTKLKQELYNLLQETHETVKNILKDNRSKSK